MTLVELLEKFWPLIASFLTLGGGWYWKNKKTKTNKRLDSLESDSKELANLKSIVDMVQNNLHNELKKKNDTIEELSKVILELNRKIETLSSQIRELNKKLNNKSEHVEDVHSVALKCNIREEGQSCKVLEYLEKNKLLKNNEPIKYNK